MTAELTQVLSPSVGSSYGEKLAKLLFSSRFYFFFQTSLSKKTPYEKKKDESDSEKSELTPKINAMIEKFYLLY